MFKSIVAAGLTFLVVAGSALAVEPCSQETQAEFLTKALGMTKEIGGKKVSKFDLGVLGGGSMVALLEKAVAASKVKINVKAVAPEAVTDVQVLFIPNGTPIELLEGSRDKARTGRVLTVSGNPQDALDHDLTLSFHAVGDKSRFLINLTAGATEKIEFAPQLLQVADRLRKD